MNDEVLQCHCQAHAYSFGELNGSRSEAVDGGATEPLTAVHDNVDLCKGTSLHPLCAKEGEAKVESQ